VFVSQPWELFIIAVLTGIDYLTVPACSAIVSKHAPPHEQGLAQGSLAGLKGLTQYAASALAATSLGSTGPLFGLCRGLGPLMFSGLFSFFTSDLAPFEFAPAPFVLGQ
jgi:DHA1 family tetracycline resistance protein-like MFS transporter